MNSFGVGENGKERVRPDRTPNRRSVAASANDPDAIRGKGKPPGSWWRAVRNDAGGLHGLLACNAFGRADNDFTQAGVSVIS